MVSMQFRVNKENHLLADIFFFHSSSEAFAVIGFE